MKKIFSLLILASTTLLYSCGGEDKNTAATTDDALVSDAQVAVEYPLDSNSMVAFTGYKPHASHTGVIPIGSGSFGINSNDDITGTFIMNVADLQITDGSEDKLRQHLIGEDFFDAANYPNATFTVTSVSLAPNEGDSSTVSGNLEMKGISKNITFPALIELNDEMIRTQASFFLDRTLWNMHYGNKESLGDKFIKPEVMINFDLVGHKSEG